MRQVYADSFTQYRRAGAVLGSTSIPTDGDTYCISAPCVAEQAAMAPK